MLPANSLLSIAMTRGRGEKEAVEVELQKLKEELHEQLTQIKQIHQEELKSMEQSIRTDMEQQINEKENKIQDLQSKINRANSIVNRYIHVMKIMCQFTNMHPDLTKEQKVFF